MKLCRKSQMRRNTSTQQVKIINFSICSVLSSNKDTINNLDSLEGTFAYMSPEQTGRINRSVDHRTDFYSLGVTFYEILAQKPPFNSITPIELVHCHIAKQPVPLHYLKPEIPRLLSEIILKLLAKTPEQRYQNAFGLKADLKNCLKQLETTGRIAEFTIAKHDCSSNLQIPAKL